MFDCTFQQLLKLVFKHQFLNLSRTRNLCLGTVLIFISSLFGFASNLVQFKTVFNTDWVSAGVGAMRENGSGTITVSGIPEGSVIKAAYLYWHGPTNSIDPTINAHGFFNNNPITGTNIGFSSDNCWQFTNSQAYRADVTSLVTGDGSYVLTGFGSGLFFNQTNATTNGASLIIFYDDGNPSNNRDVFILNGNDSNIPNSYDADGWTATITNLNYSVGTANLQLHVADGQTYLDDALKINGSTLVPAGPIFQGDSVPPSPPDPNTSGNLWDIKSFNVTPFLSHGLNTLTLTTGVFPDNGDCLSLVVAAYDLPAGAVSPSTTLHFPSGASTQTATFLSNGSPTDPASHAIAYTANVKNQNGIDVTVQAFYEQTELSSTGPNIGAPTTLAPLAGTSGIGIADGICEFGATEATDFDCRLAAGGFVFQTLPNGDQVVPHCSPYHNNMCVWYRATTTAKAQDEVPAGSPVCGPGVTPPCYDYVPGVYEKIGWNTNVPLAIPSSNPEYPAGWNNQNARLYDRHGDDPDIAFKFDITSFYDVNGSVSAVLAGDQTGGGTTRHFNDWVFADVPNPPVGTVGDRVEPVIPFPGFTFPYAAGLPMLVTFELEKTGTEIPDPSALTKPHSVNVSTRDLNGNVIQVQFPPNFPTTFSYNSALKVYYIFLSPAPYKLSDGTNNTKYMMQIGSDLFPKPVTANFKVCTFRQILSRTCP
jgi:hypothetical protein